MLQFENGYLVETVVQGNKLGVEPYTIRVSPEGELFAVDSVNSNIVRITPPLSQCTDMWIVTKLVFFLQFDYRSTVFDLFAQIAELDWLLVRSRVTLDMWMENPVTLVSIIQRALPWMKRVMFMWPILRIVPYVR